MLPAGMDTESRKAEIRRRIILSRYPTRSAAQFTDENDHNPMVLRKCPTCGGRGLRGESFEEGGTAVEVDYVCEACGGSRVVAEVEPYFPTDAPEAPASLDAAGWLTCPACRWRFTTRDPNAWTGRRH